MAAIRRSNCMILGVDHPLFVFASKRPSAAIQPFKSTHPKLPLHFVESALGPYDRMPLALFVHATSSAAVSRLRREVSARAPFRPAPSPKAR